MPPTARNLNTYTKCNQKKKKKIKKRERAEQIKERIHTHTLVEDGLHWAQQTATSKQRDNTSGGIIPCVLAQGLLKPKLNFQQLHLHGKWEAAPI